MWPWLPKKNRPVEVHVHAIHLSLVSSQDEMELQAEQSSCDSQPQANLKRSSKSKSTKGNSTRDNSMAYNPPPQLTPRIPEIPGTIFPGKQKTALNTLGNRRGLPEIPGALPPPPTKQL